MATRPASSSRSTRKARGSRLASHPRYTPTPEEEIERVKAATLEEVKAFHRDFYGASAGQLAAVGDFDPAEFKALAEEQAGRLARVEELAEEIRAGLRAHVAASPLIYEAGFTRNLEALYREAWGRWCAA